MGKPPPGTNDAADPVAAAPAALHGAEGSSDGIQNDSLPAPAGTTNRVLSFPLANTESDVHLLIDDGEPATTSSRLRKTRNDSEDEPLSFLEDGLGAARGIGAAIMFVGAFLLMALFVLWISAKMGIVP